MTSRVGRCFASFLVAGGGCRGRVFAGWFGYIWCIFAAVDEFGCSGPLRSCSHAKSAFDWHASTLTRFAACAFFRYYANICKLLMIVRVAEIKL